MKALLAALLVASFAADAAASGSAPVKAPARAHKVNRRQGIGHYDGVKLTLGSAVAPRGKETDQASGELGSQALSLAASRSRSRRGPPTSASAPATSNAAARRRSGRPGRGVPAGRAHQARFRTLVHAIDGRLPRMSTRTPGLLVVLADHSSSMAEPFAGSHLVRKADALADVVNGVLSDFVDRNNVGGVIRERLDVAVHSYGRQWGPGTALAGELSGDAIVSIRDLADNPLREIEVEDEEGFPVPQAIWVTPQAHGGTPMVEGFASARSVIAGWQRRPRERHLVLAVHVTDGESTDGDPSDQVAQLAKEVRAARGELLMTNIHLSSDGSGAGVVFPDETDAARLDATGQMLFRMSSPVPPILSEQLGTKPGARMMAYNATVEQFARVFEAGSSVAGQ